MTTNRKLNDFTIIVDTNETKPYSFYMFEPPVQLLHRHLQTADYSILGYEDRVTIERKELSDLFQSMGNSRARFQREFERLQRFEYAAMVVESDIGDIFQNPPPWSDMLPKSVFRSVVAWSQRYHVQCWFAPNRQFAERLTYILLERWLEDELEGLHL